MSEKINRGIHGTFLEGILKFTEFFFECMSVHKINKKNTKATFLYIGGEMSNIIIIFTYRYST